MYRLTPASEPSGAMPVELGKVKAGARSPGVIFIVPLAHRVHRVSLRIIRMLAFLEREGQAASTLSATPVPPPDPTHGKLVPS